MLRLPFAETKAGKIKLININIIDPNPSQPRRVFDSQGICELADSIAENGLISPVTVRKAGDRYQLIAGERRLMAFRLLGEREIPAIIEAADDDRAAIMALVENMQRRDLSFIEEIRAILLLINKLNLTQQQIAAKLGFAQSTIANKLRLLQLPLNLLENLAAQGLGERHARALLPLVGDDRLEKIAEKMISDEQVERLVESVKSQKLHSGSRILVVKELRLFTNAISKAVDAMNEAGIDADTKKTEDENTIVYTITIPKRAVQKAHLIKNRTPPKSASF